MDTKGCLVVDEDEDEGPDVAEAADGLEGVLNPSVVVQHPDVDGPPLRCQEEHGRGGAVLQDHPLGGVTMFATARWP